MSQITLKRSLSLPLITFYGLGNILGAGIYVLVGKVAGEAGYFAPIAFLVAAIIAAVSAFTYAELSARYPVSAGEAVYIEEGFGLQKLSLLVGLLITFAGIVSASAIVHGFVGYLQVFVDWPGWMVITLLLLLLGVLAAWGINLSVKTAALFTLAEIAGLLLVIAVGGQSLFSSDQFFQDLQNIKTAIPWDHFSILGIFSGAFLAFYAYIGFEDMVNVAEEVKEPQRNMPLAIMWCVIISTLLYSGVTLVAVTLMDPMTLSQSNAPLATLYTYATGDAPIVISVIGSVAVVNGALIQLIMSSRLFYGMASRKWLPTGLAHIHPRTRTPINSTLLTVGLMLFFSLVFQIVQLAEMTSYLVLIVFALVNLTLIRIKKRQPRPEGVRVFSRWVPYLGFATATLLLVFEVFSNIL